MVADTLEKETEMSIGPPMDGVGAENTFWSTMVCKILKPPPGNSQALQLDMKTIGA